MVLKTEQKIDRIISLAGRKVLPNLYMKYDGAEYNADELMDDYLRSKDINRLIREDYSAEIYKNFVKIRDSLLPCF